jgi:GT2 family glycosyltransferase
VAVSVKNEAERLPACLRALALQTNRAGAPLPRGAVGVLAFVNNCSDDSARIARRLSAQSPFETRVVEANLPAPQAHAGGARRAAMDLASAWLAEGRAFDGFILSTDADSQAAPDWIAAQFDAFAQGADAVLGDISLDAEGERLPEALRARGALEASYERLLAEISALLDPQACNPWPHHATISGASLALTRRLYERIGGLPLVRAGEDKALVAALRRRDARIRFAPDVRVVTSGRTLGRAVGGVADALRLRSADPTAPCDEGLEPCLLACRRALWRGRLRREGFAGAWPARLDLPREVAGRARAAPTFGAAWERIERASPKLARRALSPAELPREIERAARLLGRLRDRLAPRQDIEPVLRPPVGADELEEML